MSTSKGHEAGESDGRGVVEHLEVELADVRRLLQDTERSYESRVWELEQQMSHLLAHGQNRNQYTGSEPIPHRQGLQSYTDANHDKYYFCSCGTVHPEWYWNPDDWHHKVWGLEQKPTTLKPQQRRPMEIARHRVELSDAIRALLLTNLLDEDWRLVLESELDAVLERYNKLVMKGVRDATAT